MHIWQVSKPAGGFERFAVDKVLGKTVSPQAVYRSTQSEGSEGMPTECTDFACRTWSQLWFIHVLVNGSLITPPTEHHSLCTRYVLAPMVKKAFEGYDTVLIVLGESGSGKRELLGKCLVLQVGRPITECRDEFEYIAK